MHRQTAGTVLHPSAPCNQVFTPLLSGLQQQRRLCHLSAWRTRHGGAFDEGLDHLVVVVAGLAGGALCTAAGAGRGAGGDACNRAHVVCRLGCNCEAQHLFVCKRVDGAAWDVAPTAGWRRCAT